MKLNLQFLLVSFLLSVVVYRGAMIGQKIIAPIDIASNIFTEYRYLDPQANGVPANHYIIDQLTYDLPLQKTIYDSYRRGEIPWWSPYTYGGRPLLADAHCNGTDPIRIICYLLLPFELAYNWNLILRGIITGFGVLCLLRHLRFTPAIACVLSVTAQFAGCFALYIGHPWIQATALYLPFIWIALDKYLEKPSAALLGWGGLAAGLFFWSGNLQSHAYLVVFCFCWLVAVLIARRQLFSRAFISCSAFGVIGGALALPVLVNQLELFAVNVRSVGLSEDGNLGFFGGILALTFPHPFFLGTFRTLDFGKIINQSAAGFHLFIGPILALSALIGGFEIFRRIRHRLVHSSECFALVLVIMYLVICSTPLIHYFYTRIAPVGVFGLLLISAIGLRKIHEQIANGDKVKLAQRLTAGLAVLILIHSLLLPLVYPKILATLKERVGQGFPTANDPMFALRTYQTTHFVEETTLRNPEVCAALVALIIFWFALSKRNQNREKWIIAALVINGAAVVHFYSRYIPLQPISLWTNLLRGGATQQGWVRVLLPAHSRFSESSIDLNYMVFPNELGLLWQVHKVQGYAALQPPSIYRWPEGSPLPSKRETYDSLASTSPPTGTTLSPGADREFNTCRYTWSDAEIGRPIRIVSESLNRISLSIADGKEAELIRTDTSYSGWSASWNGKNLPLLRTGPVFSKMIVPAGNGRLDLSYSPVHLPMTGLVAGADVVLIFGLVFGGHIAGFHRKAERLTH